MHKVTIEQARLAFKKFEDLPNEPLGREALAEGLEELLEVKDSTSDAKTISTCCHLIDTYRRKVEDEVVSSIDRKASLSWEFLQHWYDIMAEFQSLEIEVPEKFLHLMSQLKFEIVAKQVAEQVKQLSPDERQRLLDLLEQI